MKAVKAKQVKGQSSLTSFFSSKGTIQQKLQETSIPKNNVIPSTVLADSSLAGQNEGQIFSSMQIQDSNYNLKESENLSTSQVSSNKSSDTYISALDPSGNEKQDFENKQDESLSNTVLQDDAFSEKDIDLEKENIESNNSNASSLLPKQLEITSSNKSQGFQFLNGYKNDGIIQQNQGNFIIKIDKKDEIKQKRQRIKEGRRLLKQFVSFLEMKKVDLTQRKKIELEGVCCQSVEQCELGLKILGYTTELEALKVEKEKIKELICNLMEYLERLKMKKTEKKEVEKLAEGICQDNEVNFDSFNEQMRAHKNPFIIRFFKNTDNYENHQTTTTNPQQPLDKDLKNDSQLISKKPQKLEETPQQARERYKTVNYTNIWGNLIEIHPTEEQLDFIVSDIKKDIKIVACAGSGKTTTLVLRLKYLLEKGVKPQSIIVSTFNIEAGKHISQKITEIIGNETLSKMLIGNIDKISYRFIKGELDAKQKNSKQLLLFSQREYADIWLSHIKKYQFEYMQYKYFIFDEFQDVSQLQYDILLEFKKLGCILTVVGDDAQNIYGFRETKIDIIQHRFNQDLARKKKDVAEFRLSKNYRSSNTITAFANNIIAKSENLIQKRMESVKLTKGKLPYLHIFESEREQNEIVIKQIITMVRNNELDWKDIAVLGAMNEQLKTFEEAVERNNQNARVESEQIPYQAFISLKLDEFKVIDFQEAPKQSNRITISTIHRAKGLEWQVVFFLGCNDDQFPMAFVIRNKANACSILEEQRRLFYVGVTRAISQLHLCSLGRDETRLTDKDRKLGRYKVTRFIKEIPRDLYEADPILDHSDHLMSDYTWIDQDNQLDTLESLNNLTKLSEIISSMTSKQLELINKLCDHIQTDQELTLNIFREGHKISSAIRDNQLFTEMALFFDRCLIRFIGETYQAINGFSNQVAASVILPQISNLKLSEQLLGTYIRNSRWLSTLGQSECEDLKILMCKYQKEGIKPKTDDELKIMKELLCCLSVTANIQGLKCHQLLNYKKHRANKYFEDQFERLGQSYLNALIDYMDKDKKTHEIYESVYKIAKCGLILEKRRKYLHSSNLQAILDSDHLEKLKEGFVQTYLQRYKQLECKRVYHSKYVTGQVDVICDNKCLIFFKFDAFDSFKKEDLLNYLFAAAYFRVNEGMKISQVGVLNIISGSLQILNLSDWQQDKAFLEQIDEYAHQLILARSQNDGVVPAIDSNNDTGLEPQLNQQLNLLELNIFDKEFTQKNKGLKQPNMFVPNKTEEEITTTQETVLSKGNTIFKNKTDDAMEIEYEPKDIETQLSSNQMEEEIKPLHSDEKTKDYYDFKVQPYQVQEKLIQEEPEINVNNFQAINTQNNSQNINGNQDSDAASERSQDDDEEEEEKDFLMKLRFLNNKQVVKQPTS